MKINKNYLLILIILLTTSFITALDEQLIIPCSGDQQTIIDCLGDSELFFIGKVMSETASTNTISESGGGKKNIVSQKFDIDFSHAANGTLIIQQGETKTFSFDGLTSHTILIIELNATSLYVRISSEPLFLAFTVGEKIFIDFNTDMKNDLVIELISLKSGKATFFLNTLEGTKILVTEESKLFNKEKDTVSVTRSLPEIETKEFPLQSYLIIFFIACIIVVIFFLIRKKERLPF